MYTNIEGDVVKHSKGR